MVHFIVLGLIALMMMMMMMKTRSCTFITVLTYASHIHADREK
jgi:hypothetical protein